MRKKITKKLKKINYVHWLIFLFFSFVFLYIITRGINLPYVGPYAFNFNIYSLIAHNYNHFGFLNIGLAPIISASEELPLIPDYYLHHPPLIPISEAIMFRLFGEEFWVGRMTMIIYAFGANILLYLIAKTLRNEKFALITYAIASVIPATSIFGRMIDLEPPVMFFALLSLFLILQYINNKKTYLLPFIFLCIVLGTLSEWSVVYFTFSLSIFLFYVKQFRLAIGIILASVLTSLGFMAYIFYLSSGLSDLINAFFIRSNTWTVIPHYLWPVLWISAIFTRFLIYFNPIFTILGIYYVFWAFRQYRKHKLNSEIVLILSLLIFGLIHIALYPSGSFGHIYWIYNLIPFVSLACASIIFNIRKKSILILFIFIFSILFLFGVSKWKTGELVGNVWRYDLAMNADKVLQDYEKVAVNKDSALDTDVLRYKFLHEYVVLKPIDLENNREVNHYIFSCNGVCDTSNEEFKYLFNKFEYIKLNSSGGEAYVFILDKQKRTEIKEKKTLISLEQQIVTTAQPVGESYRSKFKLIYLYIVKTLQVPFL